MRVLIKCFFIVILGFAIITPASFAKEEIKYSGFLKDYSKLKEGPKGGLDRVHIKPGVDFKKYNKIMMDRVVFYFKDDAENKEIDPEELKELADAFHKSMIESLNEAYPMVSEPGPDVLRVRVAITELEPVKVGINTITTIIPVGLIFSAIKKGRTGSAAFSGKAVMEVELLDSKTNEQLAIGVDSRGGTKLKIAKGVTKWGLVKDIFNTWAERFRKFMDEKHGKK